MLQQAIAALLSVSSARYEARNLRNATEVARKGKINNAASNANVR
jgi:hypothetical protein